MTSSINYYIKFLIIIPRIIRLNNSPPHPKKKKLFFHFHATRIKKRSDALDRKRLYAGHWVTIHDQMASVAARAGANRRRQRHAPGHVLPREHTCDTADRFKRGARRFRVHLLLRWIRSYRSRECSIIRVTAN